MAKPGEKPFALILDPDEKIIYKGKLGEPITIERKITNNTNERHAFKVKCTSNDIFQVRQPLGFVEPKETVTVKITFVGKSVPENLKHFFAFYHVKSDKKTDAAKTARQVWTVGKIPQGVSRQLCLFELTDEKKEEKKEIQIPQPEVKEEEKKEEKKEEEKKEEENKEEGEKKDAKEEEKK